MSNRRTKLFIEAVPLVDHQVSGVPHTLAGLVAALAKNPHIQAEFEIVLVVPGSRMQLLDRWPGLETCTRKAIPMKFRIMNGLARRGLLPPMDLLLGPGVYLFGNFFNWSLTKRSRSFTYIHDICFATHPQYVQPDNQRMLEKNVPRYIKQTNYIITVSQAARQEIIDYFHVDRDHVITVYNAAAERYKPYPLAQVQAVKEKYGLGNKPYFLFVGNIEPRKNLERLVQAMMQLPKDQALMMVGSDGWLNERVFALIEEANKAGHTIIKPHTFVPDEDVVRLLSGATALAMPSLYEGFGLPALEAIMSHTPAVVADIPPLREVAGDAGIYCNPESVDSIATALQKSLALKTKGREALIQKGLVHAAQFSWEKSAAQLTPLLQKAAKELT